jgi:ABC-type phosphate transport system substrate-binding protein
VAARLLGLAGLILGLILLAPATLGAEPIRVGRTGSASRTVALLAESYQRQTPGTQIVVLPSIGSRGAKKDLITGAVDVMLIAATDQEAADAIASVPGALGTTTLALIVAEKRPLTAVALDGVIPGMKTIASGTYPHTKTIYVVVRPQEARPAVAGFVRFLQTPDARVIVAGTGFLPLPARPSP